jgi:uncharacterized 2Fe-2S/4Fe-4S cluster protein (DUF4445 family)
VSRHDPLVVFTPSGKRGRFAIGTPLLAAARTLGVDIDSVCGGRAICGRCQVLVAEGEFAKHGVGPPPRSRRCRNPAALRPAAAAGRRLSCGQAEVVVDVPPGSQFIARSVPPRRDIELIRSSSCVGQGRNPQDLRATCNGSRLRSRGNGSSDLNAI